MDGGEHGGERRVGPYRLIRTLGRGGFGEVHLAEDAAGGRAAVKVLHASWSGDDGMRRRFAAEVDQARRVSGFCIAPILDADPEAERPWIATEYIDGPTLQDAVTEGGPRTGADLHRLAVSTATALAAIHGAGVVHRDFKPDNILLAADGPRVIDFGIARAVESTSVTASGIVGTVGYMAPEQLEGLRLGPAVDVFAWGAVMAFAATGREAFAAPTQVARITRILSGEPDLGGIPEPLHGVIAASLAKQPEARPSGRALLDLLLTAGTAGTASPAAPAAPYSPPGQGGHTPPYAPPAVPAYVPPSFPPGAPVSPAPGAPPPSGTQVEPFAEPYRAPSAGGVPPYWFGGAKFTEPGALAAAMQRDWQRAAAVFADDGARDALGRWVIDDARDTLVDRSLFRRRPDDAGIALAWFIAQLRPDLPPAFRGRDATVEGLRSELGAVRPATTNAPRAHETLLLSRPEVLSAMALHEGPDAADRRRLVADLEEAERAAVRLRDRVGAAMPHFATAPVDSALILSYLLHPERIAPPETSGGGAHAAEIVRTMWAEAERSRGAQRAGAAAVINAAAERIASRGQEHAQWSASLDQARRAETEARSALERERRLASNAGMLEVPLWVLIALVVVVGVITVAADWGMTAVTLVVLAWGGARIGAIAVRSKQGPQVGYYSPEQMAQWKLKQSQAHLAQLYETVIRMDEELAHLVGEFGPPLVSGGPAAAVGAAPEAVRGAAPATAIAPPQGAAGAPSTTVEPAGPTRVAGPESGSAAPAQARSAAPGPAGQTSVVSPAPGSGEQTSIVPPLPSRGEATSVLPPAPGSTQQIPPRGGPGQ